MKVPRLFFSLVFFVILTAYGCSSSSGSSSSGTGKLEVHSPGNPSAEEVLTSDPEADIFQFEGLIYVNGIDWVGELTLTKGAQVGEIKKRNDTDTNFENEMSNKLPVGAKIFSPIEKKGPILLVESEGKILKYHALIEG
ncbi:hypothetical protein QTL97_14570 [Sporosarcina thermotolerans]|uniref:Uncharacterized protein n=1 Tax=Sporosarcina thermotolerans TaxID=633404 RepID=A0AAW9AEW3_9BACL|nr:hypothetical protein [Sporosarcina thermotolerans]MDW0115351.1 hypothetical protein [Sporosarcina thermotolerans]MDW0118153.1 hypothetical protein [Sporosarcina thermotolerans]WHT47306.1 hypothetical protein QNH10_13960 [Sporosarcina thermotolerans]WHT47642.1 hypothetical protein QNH10_16110 [Sporosarcina thermotolerans]